MHRPAACRVGVVLYAVLVLLAIVLTWPILMSAGAIAIVVPLAYAPLSYRIICIAAGAITFFMGVIFSLA